MIQPEWRSHSLLLVPPCASTQAALPRAESGKTSLWAIGDVFLILGQAPAIITAPRHHRVYWCTLIGCWISIAMQMR